VARWQSVGVKRKWIFLVKYRLPRKKIDNHSVIVRELEITRYYSITLP